MPMKQVSQKSLTATFLFLAADWCNQSESSASQPREVCADYFAVKNHPLPIIKSVAGDFFYFTFNSFLNNFSELFSVSCLLILWKSCAVSCLECFKSLINNFLISLICILLCIILIHCIKFFWLAHGQRISELLVQLA